MGLLGDPTPATTTTTADYTEAERAAKKKILKKGEELFDASAPLYDHSTVAAPVGPSAATTQGQQTLLDWSTGQGADYSKMLGTATQYGLQGAMDVKNNPYLQSAMQAAINPVTAQYNDPGGVLANIRSDAVQAGQYGGTRQGLESGIAGGKYLQTIGDMTAKMGSEAYRTGQDTFAKVLALTPETMKASLRPGLVQSAVGMQQEGYTAGENQYAADLALESQNKGWIPLQNYANIVNAESNPMMRTTMHGGGPSAGASMLAGAAAGASIGSVIPGIGTALGAAAGAILSLL